VDPEHAETLIQRYIEPSPHRPGKADARLRQYGVSIWALIGSLPGVGGDMASTSAAFEVPVQGVEDACAYDGRHREVIDGRIAANAA
jgi:hypothetical protein